MQEKPGLIRKFRYAVAFTQSTRLFAKGDERSAIEALDRVFIHPSGELWMSVPTLVAIRYAVLYERLGNFEKALQFIKIGADKLDRSVNASNRRISKADREYLYFYCKWIFSRRSHLYPQAAEATLTIGGNFAMLDIRRTSGYIKRAFPIPASAGQLVDEIVEQHMPQISLPPSNKHSG